MEPGTEVQKTEYDEANITKINVSEDKKMEYSTSLEHTQDKQNNDFTVKGDSATGLAELQKH